MATKTLEVGISRGSLPKGEVIPQIRAIDVYPLLMAILGLEITTPIDGDSALLPALLENEESVP